MTAAHLRATMACRQHHFMQAERVSTTEALDHGTEIRQTVTLLHCVNCDAWKPVDFKREAMVS